MTRFIKSGMKSTRDGDLIWESRIREANGEVIAKSKVRRRDEHNVRETFRTLFSLGFVMKDTPVNPLNDREIREELQRQEDLRIREIVRKSNEEDQARIKRFMQS